MAKIRKVGIIGIGMLGLGAIALITNPGERGYQNYVEETLKSSFKDKVCTEVAKEMGTWLAGPCPTLVDIASPNLSQVVSQQTERQNFFLFSIYQVDFPLPSPLPKYHVETIGVLGNFYTYQAKKL